jgi:hypothetical protein
MNSRPRRNRAALHLGAALCLWLFTPLLAAQAPVDLSALIGRWQLDPSRTHMGRLGPNAQNLVRSPTFTFIFEPDGQNLKVNVYAEYPQSAPTRTMALIPDGQMHRCQDKAACLTIGGDASEQSYVYHVIDAHFVIRMFYVKGQLTEYSTYAVSSDGKTFTLMSWSPETPYYQNIQVFEKQSP